MSNLLRSAIADAKMIKHTALENAKAALQEAFTPKLQRMLEKKIAEEASTDMALDSEPAYADGKKLENPSGANDVMNPPKVKEAYAVYGDNGKESINLSEDGEDEFDLGGGEDELGDDQDAENGAPQVQVPDGEVEVDIDASAAPIDIVPTGGDVHIDPAFAQQGEEGQEGMENQSSDDMELESIIKELEDEANDDGEEVEEPSFDSAESEEGAATDSITVGQRPDDVTVDYNDEDPNASPDEEEDTENFDLEEILRELDEEEEDECMVSEELTTDQPLKANTEKPQKGNWGSDKTGTNNTPSQGGGNPPAVEKAESDSKYGKVNKSAGSNFGPDKTGIDKTAVMSENSKLKKELVEHKKAVEYLKSKINEVNLLNAKLLYTTKLFRNYPLTNEQKVKVVESLDLTKNVREVKLVYATLAESFNFGSNSNVKKKTLSSSRKTITEGLASKPVASTKPSERTVLAESVVAVNRFQKLAGIGINKKNKR